MSRYDHHCVMPTHRESRIVVPMSWYEHRLTLVLRYVGVSSGKASVVKDTLKKASIRASLPLLQPSHMLFLSRRVCPKIVKKIVENAMMHAKYKVQRLM